MYYNTKGERGVPLNPGTANINALLCTLGCHRLLDTNPFRILLKLFLEFRILPELRFEV